MAAYELPEGSISTGEDGYVNATRVFRVITGNAALRPEWGVAGVSINRFDSYPGNAGLIAVGASSVPHANHLGIFDVTYTYTDKPMERQTTDTSAAPGDSDANLVSPPDRSPKVSWRSNTREVPFLKDWDTPRKAVANSAHQPYEGQTVEDFTEILTVSFYMAPATDIGVKQDTYTNKVNDDAFAVLPIYTAYPEGTLRCNSWSGELAVEPQWGVYLHVSVEFEYKPDGWHRDYIDMGTAYKVVGQYVDGVQVMRKFRDTATGQPLDSPRKLNGAGEPLNPGDNPTLAMPFFVENGGAQDVTVYQRFYPYEWVDFTNIFS